MVSNGWILEDVDHCNSNTKLRAGDSVCDLCSHSRYAPQMSPGIPPLTSPLWVPHWESPGGGGFPMLPCWSTCSTNSGVDVAAAVIGRDKISSTFITDSLCSIYSASLPFYQLQAHPRWPPLQPKQNFPRETLCDGEKTQIKSRAMCPLRQQHLSEISLECLVWLFLSFLQLHN